MSFGESLCCCYSPSLSKKEIVVAQPKPQTEEASQAGTEPKDEEKSETGIYQAGTEPKPQDEKISQAGGGSQAGDRPARETSPAGSEDGSRVASETEAGSEDGSQAGSTPKKNPFFKPGQDEDALSPFLKWIKSQTTFKEARGESWKAIKHNNKNLFGLHKEPGTSFQPEEFHTPAKQYTQEQSQQQARY